MSKPLPLRSAAAEQIVQQLIVKQGMSYAAAVQWCERRAEQIEAPAKPYREVAAELGGFLLGKSSS